MSSLGNKSVLAKNLSYYLNRTGKSQREMAEIVGVSPAAFSDWINGRKYPRIDKIELLANYFGVLKSDLIEEKSSSVPSVEPSDSQQPDSPPPEDPVTAEILNAVRSMPADQQQQVLQFAKYLADRAADRAQK